MKASTKSILEGPASQFPTIFTAFVLLLKTLADTIARYKNRNLKPKNRIGRLKNRNSKRTDTIGRYKNRNLRPRNLIGRLKNRNSKRTDTIGRHKNRNLASTDYIVRYNRKIESVSEDRIGIGRSINRTFRPPLLSWQHCFSETLLHPHCLDYSNSLPLYFGYCVPCQRVKLCLC